MVGGVLALGLAALFSALAGGALVATVPDLPTAPAPPISLTTVNWGHPVSLLNPENPAWSHLAPLAGPTEVTATFALRGVHVHDWVAHAEAPGAYGGVQPEDCSGSEDAAPVELSCVFEVPVSSGVNELTVTFSADGQVLGRADGFIRGGELNWDAGYELLDASGKWTAIDRHRAASLPATLPTAERIVITNTGTIPMRVVSAPCSTRVLAPHARLSCPVRGVRPAQSLAGDLRRQLRVADAVGGIAEFEIRGSLTTFSGSFSLSRASAVVGQPIVVHAHGLPADQPFDVQYRLNQQADPLGTSITRTGTLRYGFVVPRSRPGTLHLDVVHDGVTIASLPFEVTRVPTVDAAASPGGLVAIPLGILAGVLAGVFVALRIRRRRQLAATASPAPRPTDPYPDATPATPEPEAVRPR
jgi:hypothetical protein